MNDMNGSIIVTNNPMLKEKFKDYEILFVKDLNEVYKKSRDLIHKNWSLMSHPLAGSVKPAQNPYRSIVLKEASKLDFYSLETIENAIYKLKQFATNHQEREYPEQIKEDYQVIDLTLMNSALEN